MDMCIKDKDVILIVYFNSLYYNLFLQRLCFNYNHTTPETIVSESLESIEGMAYDWMSESLFWVDARTNDNKTKIEVARSNGFHRRVLVNSSHLDRPRAIALYPQHG